MKKCFHLYFLCIICFYDTAFAQLIIAPTTPQNGVQNSLLGPGVTVSNITYQGVPNSLATFSGTSSIGITSGLFLGTGAADSIGNPALFFMSDGAAGPGDSDLQTIASGVVQDAAILEFDFQVASDSVKFNFVFASEEYSDYANTAFNDVFGFFISGPGITGSQNIALIPGTTTPVTINNVNNGNSPANSIPTGPCMNCSFFQDNTNNLTNAFDGFTTIITAISAVQPCTSYHIKLAVANVNDGAFDSGVFLQSNSFAACGPTTVFNGLNPIVDTLHLCNGSTATIASCVALNYLWSTGSTTQSITVSQPGTYSVTTSNGNCSAVSTPIIVVTDSSFQQPQISQIGNALVSDITDPTYTYEWYLNGMAISNTNGTSYNVLTGGCYQVMITSPEGCTSLSDSVCLSFTGMGSSEAGNPSFTVSPNPMHGSTRIQFNNPQQDLFRLTLYDIFGRPIQEVETRSNQILLFPKTVSGASYSICLKNQRTQQQTWKKLVVQ